MRAGREESRLRVHPGDSFRWPTAQETSTRQVFGERLCGVCNHSAIRASPLSAALCAPTAPIRMRYGVQGARALRHAARRPGELIWSPDCACRLRGFQRRGCLGLELWVHAACHVTAVRHGLPWPPGAAAPAPAPDPAWVCATDAAPPCPASDGPPRTAVQTPARVPPGLAGRERPRLAEVGTEPEPAAAGGWSGAGQPPGAWAHGQDSAAGPNPNPAAAQAPAQLPQLSPGAPGTPAQPPPAGGADEQRWGGAVDAQGVPIAAKLRRARERREALARARAGAAAGAPTPHTPPTQHMAPAEPSTYHANAAPAGTLDGRIALSPEDSAGLEARKAAFAPECASGAPALGAAPAPQTHQGGGGGTSAAAPVWGAAVDANGMPIAVKLARARERQAAAKRKREAEAAAFL